MDPAGRRRCISSSRFIIFITVFCFDLCLLLLFFCCSSVVLSIQLGCTTISGAIKDLNLLIEELHVQEFQHDRAVLFLRNALLCLDKRLDAQVFHKPLQVQQRGAASFHTSSSERVERTDESYGGRYCCGSDAHMESGHAGSSAPVGFADAALGTLTTNAGRCLDVTRDYLSSNPYASIDMCSDLDCTSRRSDGSSSASSSSDNSLTTPSATPATQASQCACNMTYAQELVGLGGSSNAPPAHHLPYVGNLIALHSGHNGWPAATALASLNDFFVASTVA